MFQLEKKVKENFYDYILCKGKCDDDDDTFIISFLLLLEVKSP